MHYHHMHYYNFYCMPLLDFLSLPQKGWRTWSKIRSAADATQGPSEAGLVAPRPAESDPDLETGSSTFSTSTPSTLQNRVSSGMQIALFWTAHLTVLQKVGKGVSNPTQSVAKKAKRPKPWDRILNRNTATSETKSESSLGSTAYTKEPSDVSPPLRSIVSGLTTALEHYDVCSAS